MQTLGFKSLGLRLAAINTILAPKKPMKSKFKFFLEPNETRRGKPKIHDCK